MSQHNQGISKIEGLQGLRFLAVLFVLLFHLKIETFANGFLGVDIFFVISGFIVTRIYFDRITGKSEILRFFVKRFCRIVPMVVIISVVSIFAATLLFPPELLEINAKHFFSSIFFFSNFVFWGETGYFDLKSEYKLFLHTWSLSVEWQFYILFPVFTFILHQFSSRKPALIFVMLCCAVSWSLFLAFQNYINFVFYNLPFRGWEFASGCLIGLLPQAQGRVWARIPMRGGGGVEACLVLCLFLIVCTPFGWFSDPVLRLTGIVFITSILIFLVQSRSVILGSRVFRRLGDASYSIYLWHWPLVVMVFNYLPEDPQPSAKTGIIIICVLLGLLTHEFIEKKFNFRNRKKSSLKWLILSVTGFAGICFASIVIYTSGLPNRYDAEDQLRITYFESLPPPPVFGEVFRSYQEPYGPGNGICRMGKVGQGESGFTYDDFNQCVDQLKSTPDQNKPRFIVIGDSNGRDFYYSLIRGFPEIQFSMINHDGCAPGIPKCFPGLWELLGRRGFFPNADGFIIASRFTEYPINNLPDFLDDLKGINQHILLAGPSLVLRHEPVWTWTRFNIPVDGSQVLLPRNSRIFHPDSMTGPLILRDLAALKNVRFLDRVALFCNTVDCTISLENGTPLLGDTSHLSASGIAFLAERLKSSRIVDGFLHTRK